MFATRVGFYKQPASAVITVTGGTLTFDGAYSVRTFTSDGTLGISGGNLACEYLVVGGGGRGDFGNYDVVGAAAGRGGGGGSGGQTLTGSTTINSGSYAVTIGNSQENTSVGSLFTALKGNDGSFRIGGSSVGGSGAGGNGENTPTGIPAQNGQNGVLSTISGSSVRYGAGGGGGANFAFGSGGTTGGGNGGNYQTPTNATAGTNGTGSGGGGGATSSNRGAGGRGIFIIRYLTAGTN